MRTGDLVRDTTVNKFITRVRVLFQGHLSCYPQALSLVEGKAGLEIGGPSSVFRYRFMPLPIYDTVGSLDNCDFSQSTVWSSHSADFRFNSRKAPGNSIFCDGSALKVVSDQSYDFILSSHNLEHFANPVKALREWQRVTRPGGSLILVLPDYARTFDHRRKLTSVAHMFEDFERNTGEDDQTHLPEILSMHDLSMDRAAGTLEQFHRRCLNSFNNRCVHHHVFNEDNSRELLQQVGMEVLAVEKALPYHIFLLARMHAQ